MADSSMAMPAKTPSITERSRFDAIDSVLICSNVFMSSRGWSLFTVYSSVNCLLKRRWVHGSADHDRLKVNRTLFVCHIYAGVIALIVEAAHCFIRNYANDLPGDLRTQLRLAGNDFLNEDALANRVLLREVLPRHGLIN